LIINFDIGIILFKDQSVEVTLNFVIVFKIFYIDCIFVSCVHVELQLLNPMVYVQKKLEFRYLVYNCMIYMYNVIYNVLERRKGNFDCISSYKNRVYFGLKKFAIYLVVSTKNTVCGKLIQ